MCSQLITEQAEIALTRGAEVNGRCGHNESELQVFWVDRAYTLKMLFVKVIGMGVQRDGEARMDERGSGLWAVHYKAVGVVHRSLPVLAGESQHFQRTRSNLEAEQGAVCL